MKNKTSQTTAKNIPVIYYHSVAPRQNPNWPKKYLTLPLRHFEAQLRHFKSAGYRTLCMAEYLDCRENNSLTGKCLVLTFDDGYLDNYVYVYPLLKKYGFTGTVFVNPESVPKEDNPCITLLDYWSGKASFSSLEKWGFMNWEEMRLLERSGVLEIQSHTWTHTKHFVSSRLEGFHHPGADALHYIGSLYPDAIPYYIGNEEFESLLPFGYPVFEQRSALIARKVEINREFISEALCLLAGMNWTRKDAILEARAKTRALYHRCLEADKILVNQESEAESRQRAIANILLAKETIDQQLGKSCIVCCWPHGDNDSGLHAKALELGFRATTLGKMPASQLDDGRIERMGLGYSRCSATMTRLFARALISSQRGVAPYYQLRKLYSSIKRKRVNSYRMTAKHSVRQ